jgi:hypothetical protein
LGRFFLAIAFGDITTSTFLSTANFSHIHNPLRQISIPSKWNSAYVHNNIQYLSSSPIQKARFSAKRVWDGASDCVCAFLYYHFLLEAEVVLAPIVEAVVVVVTYEFERPEWASSHE